MEKRKQSWGRSQAHEMKREARNRGRTWRRENDESDTEGNMTNLENATENYIAAILDSEEYRAYLAELEKVKETPELKKQIDDFRRRNYEFQSSPDCDFGKLDRFEKEYENFRQDPLVADFLAAELALCRLMQQLNNQVIAALHFE